MIAFSKWRYLSFALGFFLVFSGCDEIFKTELDGQKGDIVWIGNGLRLEKNHGVIVDILDANSGPQSFLLSQGRLQPLVRDEGSRDSVPVRLDWAVANLGDVGPTLQFELLNRESDCSRYLLNRENLICHDALNSLEIKAGTLPLSLDHDQLLYVDLFDSLHFLELGSNQLKDYIISGNVEHFFNLSSRFVFTKTKDELEWNCWESSSINQSFLKCESLSLEGFEHFVKLPSGKVMGLSFGSPLRERGFYQFFIEDKAIAYELVHHIPDEWSFVSIGESQDLLRVATPDQREHWLRIIPKGFEWIELDDRSEIDDLELHQEDDFFLSKIEGEFFELCEKGNDEFVSIANCQPLQRSDSYQFVDMILFHEYNDSTVKLLGISRSNLTPLADDDSYLISTYEVRRGFTGGFYLVELSETGFQSPILDIKTFDLRSSKTDSQD